MPSVTIRDVPDDILQLLRTRARRNHRSLNGEILALLEAQALAPVVDPRSFIAEVRDIHARYDIDPVDHSDIDRFKREGRA